MNKIDKQLEKIIDKVFIQHNLLYMVDKEIGAYQTNGSWDLNFVKLDLISKIKQSILKAIMERKPKIEHDDWEHDCDGCSILGERRGIERYESVIKEVLR